MRQISVAFVDDHPIFLSGLSQLFSASKDFSVVAIGKCASDITEIADSFHPDVIVTDLGMPGFVMDAIARVARNDEKTKLIVFTASSNIDTAISAFEAGALGYLVKGSTLEELSDAIHQVHDGETYLSPRLAAKVMAGVQNNKRRDSASRVCFSKREEDVLRLLLKGATNKSIADELFLSEKTVKHYMTLLIQKLQVRNRVEVVLAAQELAKSNSRLTARILN